MRIIYEPDGDVLEIRLTEEGWVKTVDINPDNVAHLDAQGRLAAIEIFGASESYPLQEVVLYSTEPLKPLSEMSEIAGLVPDALKHAAQQGKLKAVKIGRNWATTRSWVMEYLRSSRKSRVRLASLPECQRSVTEKSGNIERDDAQVFPSEN